MVSLLFLGALSVLLSLVITPVVRWAFHRLNILDHPDQDRKRHTRPVPRVGGLAIAVSYALSFLILLLTHASGAMMVRSALPFIWRVVPAATLAFTTGLVDDIFGLRPGHKIAGQLAAAVAAYVAGIQITAVGTGNGHPLHWWSCPLTLIWLIACMNAFNLIDGLDGLASGIGLVASTTTLLAALIQRNVPLAFAILPLAGALLGFLRYNFNPATIFLGDSGSLFVGFLLGCSAVVWSEKSATMLGMAAPLIALGIPLLDTVLAIGRRFLRGKPIFGGDRAHIHHRLLDAGLSPRQVALQLYGLCAVCALLSLFVTNHRQEVVVIGIFCVAVWVGVQGLHYAEFDLAGRLIAEGWLHQLINAEILLRAFEAKLQAAETPEQCWAALKQSYPDFGFVEIYAELGHRTYSDTRVYGGRSWDVNISFPPNVKISLGACRPSKRQRVFAPYVDAICTVLEAKLASLQPADAEPILARGPEVQPAAEWSPAEAKA
jgi:UDP-GlcNAc:undecaprenyl-phosphate/decaprenyl-phosphate GlcNAc-1-phosphate transferase